LSEALKQSLDLALFWEYRAVLLSGLLFELQEHVLADSNREARRLNGVWLVNARRAPRQPIR